MNLFEIQANIDRILEYAAENGGDIGESGAEELAISEVPENYYKRTWEVTITNDN